MGKCIECGKEHHLTICGECLDKKDKKFLDEKFKKEKEDKEKKDK